MRAPDWKDKLGRVPCGCADRKYIMFEAGKIGMYQAMGLVIAAAAVLIIAGRAK